MHDNHDLFTQALKERRKVILSYFSREHGLGLTKLCVPLCYSQPTSGEDSDRYYFWDSDREPGKRILYLSPSQITYMDLSDETFDPSEHRSTDTDLDGRRV